MATSQEEQRLRAELSRKKAALQNKISDRAVAKRLAESASESPEKRAQARSKFNALNTEIAAAEKEITKLEDGVKKEQARKEVIDVKANYDRLKSQYDLVMDKSSPEAKALAERVNAEVSKLNDAYKNSGSSTRVTPISTVTFPSSQAQSSAEQGRATLRGTKTVTPTTPSTPVVSGDKKTPGTPAGNKGTGTTGNKGTGEKPKTKEELYADAIALAVEKYNMPDIIFKNVDSLKALLNKYINNELTDAQFKREIELDPWYRSNSAEIKARYVQLFNYEDLVKQGRATGTTDYEQKINSITRKIQARAREINGIDIPEDQAKLMAKDLYIYNLDNDPSVITERLARFIRPSAGMIGGIPTTGYGGQALQNYQALQAIAKANGMKIQDLLPRDASGNPMTAEGTLEQLATGKLDITRIAQDARKLAALGQPEFVKDLLGQGYDLDTIYSPYRNSMANILELDPNTISLSDPALRMGIAKNGDINLYDYERALRQDGRWQYTQQARGEVADAALRVLRDFGFTG